MYDKNYYLVAINPWYYTYYNRRTDETIHISKEHYIEYHQNKEKQMLDYIETFAHNHD